MLVAWSELVCPATLLLLTHDESILAVTFGDFKGHQYLPPPPPWPLLLKTKGFCSQPDGAGGDLAGIAVLQVLHESEGPFPTTVENTVILRSPTSYKRCNTSYTEVPKVSRCLFSYNNRNTTLQCPISHLNTACPNTYSSITRRIRPCTQKTFALFFWKWWRWCCLCSSVLHLTKTPHHSYQTWPPQLLQVFQFLCLI